MIRVCFVCLGNICRSPTAEAVMRHLVEAEGLMEHIAIDSAGTSAYHAGESPDERSAQAAAARGVHMHGASRQFKQRDFHRFDYILAMDSDNFHALAESAATDELRSKIYLLRSFDAESAEGAEVPDPYYGGPGGFDSVFDICDAACRGLLAFLRSKHNF